MKYSVIVPCYNEGGNIGQLVAVLDTLKHPFDIEWIMVENGSADNTREILKKDCEGNKRFRVVYLDKNLGYGYGIRKGLEVAEGDYVGWMHGDMQISPKYMLRFIKAVENGDKDIRLFLKATRKNREALDAFFTNSMGIFASLLFGVYLYDIGAVPVLFHKDLLSAMPQIPYDFSIETYVYLAARRERYQIKRYPVILIPRPKGASSWNRGLHSKLMWSVAIVQDIIKIKRKIQVK